VKVFSKYWFQDDRIKEGEMLGVAFPAPYTGNGSRDSKWVRILVVTLSSPTEFRIFLSPQDPSPNHICEVLLTRSYDSVNCHRFACTFQEFTLARHWWLMHKILAT
jgi:hypothetical protein